MTVAAFMRLRTAGLARFFGHGRPLSLSKRIFFLAVILILLSVGVETFFITRHIQNYAIEEGRNKILSIAEKTARDPRIIEAFTRTNPSRVIQPIAETIRVTTGTSYVVVMNMDAIRYSHPEPDLIGRHFSGGDEKASLKGSTFISQIQGPLGVSQRAFVPVIDENKRQVGVVAVGLMLTEIKKQQSKILSMVYLVALISLLIGLGGAILLSRNIKKSIFGLEPHEISAILEERNVILSSIREGVVAIDSEGRVILINDTARKIFGLQGFMPNQPIAELLPNDRLPLVIETGNPIFDEEQVLGDKVVLVNRVPLISQGRIIGAVATFRDMGEIRRLAEELTEVRKYIDALREQHHEHLNKLHIISGLLQLKDYEEAVHFTIKTVSQKQKLSDFLRARIKSPLVSGLLFSKTEEAREHHIHIAIAPESSFPRLPDDVCVSVVTILGNILENAIESLISSDRQDKEITLLMAEREEHLEIAVRDNGDGFPEELKMKVLDKGFTTKNPRKNMGMGLYLVKREVERLKGALQISCEHGAAFTVTLPKQYLQENLG
jgi:sensor histidine kinase regulating citrate/malate metabolism